MCYTKVCTFIWFFSNNDLCSEKCHLLIISVKKQRVDSHVVHRIHYAGEPRAGGEGNRKDKAGGWCKRYWEG